MDTGHKNIFITSIKEVV